MVGKLRYAVGTQLRFNGPLLEDYVFVDLEALVDWLSDSYHVTTESNFMQSDESASKRPTKKLPERFSSWPALLREVKVTPDGRFFHDCSGSDCCGGYSRDVCITKIVSCLSSAAFATKPQAPHMAKWTELAPAGQFFLLVLLLG